MVHYFLPTLLDTNKWRAYIIKENYAWEFIPLQLEDTKQFRQIHSKTPGHPENFMTSGVEVTTGLSLEHILRVWLSYLQRCSYLTSLYFVMHTANYAIDIGVTSLEACLAVHGLNLSFEICYDGNWA